MKKVLIIDSGSGGINVLKKCMEKCPQCNYMLYLDRKNLPYGEKTCLELQNIAKEIVEKFSVFDPDIVILGCNTLTAVAISLLRETFPSKTFIGAEPAILPAIRKFQPDQILVLATGVTINNSRVLQEWTDICYNPPHLPKIIDDNLGSREKIVEYLKEIMPKTQPKGIVLGCTHFEGIINELKQIYPNAEYFTSSEGIADRLNNLLR